MKIEFLKDHVNNKAGDIVENHPNEQYLITLGVAKDAGTEAPKKSKKNGKG